MTLIDDDKMPNAVPKVRCFMITVIYYRNGEVKKRKWKRKKSEQKKRLRNEYG